MGLFDIFSSPDSVGNTVLTAYYNEAVKYPDFAYPSYDSWIAFLQTQVSDIVSLVGGLVQDNSASTTTDQSSARVADLANQSGGQATIPQIVSTAGGKGETVNWVAGIPQIVEGTAVDAASAATNLAANVGTGVLGTLNLVQYLPWILGGAAALYIYTLAKTSGKEIGEGAKRLSEAAASRIQKNPRRRRRRK